MASEWPRLTLREAHVDLIDCDHRTPPASESGYPYVTIPQLNDGRIDVTSARRITPAYFIEWTRRAAPAPDDVVLSRRTNPGVTAFVPERLDFALGQNLVLLRADATVVYPPFLRWLVRGPEWWEQIGRFLNVGAVFDSLKCADIPNFRLRIPPLSEQRRIAHILGALDDKIELNRRTNETLEAIARALFKSWFVDFDPVRAKSEGRDPGLPPHLADLFADSFEDSELGEIPKGWRVMAIADLADVNLRALDRTDRLDVIDYVEISEVTRGQVANVVRYERGTEPSRARRRLVHGDTVLSTVRPDRGSYFLSLSPPETLVVSTGFAVASPRDGNWAFLYSALTRPEVGDELGRLADGGAYPAVRPEAVMEFRLASPPGGELRNAYDALAQSLYERSEHNRIENQQLTSARDTLLPKLISGEMRTHAGYLPSG